MPLLPSKTIYGIGKVVVPEFSLLSLSAFFWHFGQTLKLSGAQSLQKCFG